MFNKLLPSPRSQSGFTLIEVVVIAPVMILAISALIVILVGIMVSNTVSRGQAAAAYDVQTALRTIERDTKNSSLQLAGIDAGFTDLYGTTLLPNQAPADAITHTGASATVRSLLLRGFAEAADSSGNKNVVFLAQNGCATPSNNPILTKNVLYFVRAGNLYRRVLTDAASATCNTQIDRHTCPPGRTNNAASNLQCKADDSLVVSGVSAFDVQYYVNPDGSTPISGTYSCNPSPGCPAVLATAKTIVVTITAKRRVAGEPVTFTDSVRISKLN